MVRSLWTAATGMIAQQTNIDTIANNLANVNTTGYKTQVNEFRSLLYQNIQARTTTADGSAKPVGAQVGLGVRNASIMTIFEQGSLQATESDSAFAIDGSGFFAVKADDGETYYTRNGSFQWTIGSNGTTMLSTSDGFPVLDSTGKAITLDATKYATSKITISTSGEVCYPDENNNPASLGISIGLFQFTNPSGLSREGNSLYAVTAASGAAIVAQRSYELNSKAITASDEMMQQANNLRR